LQIHNKSFWLIAAQVALPIARQAEALQQEYKRKIHGNNLCICKNAKLEPKRNGKPTTWSLCTTVAILNIEIDSLIAKTELQANK